MKDTKTRSIECKKQVQKSKNPYHKNANKIQNRLTPLKLESDKQDQKVLVSREGSGGKSPLNDRKRPRPTYITVFKSKVICDIYRIVINFLRK